MSNSIQPVQPVNTQAQVQAATPAPKNPPPTTPAAAPQDKVTISQQAQQALASHAKPAAAGDINHDGDSH